MRFAPPLMRGRLVRRYKRFLADVETPEGIVTVHCPNTGAMTGCSAPGLEVWCSEALNPRRKYPLTLEVVCTPTGRVGINSARANTLVAEALAARRIAELCDHPAVHPETRIPAEAGAASGGRFDFRLDGAGGRCWLEVKSLTLCHPDGRGAFPDAASERAVRHVEALAERRRLGDRAVLLFCVQHTGVRFATPADDVHPGYGAALRAAKRAGVEVLAYGCRIDRNGMAVTCPLPVVL